MSILFSDLDNTLIYSRRRKITKPKLVIEYFEGHEQSFMTKYTYDFLTNADWLRLVPVTTRTEKQFKRIEFSDRFGIKYAIVCNGGKLLVNGKEDEKWKYETYELTRDSMDALDDGFERLSSFCTNETVHRPVDYMCYVKCSDPVKTHKYIMQYADLSKVDVHLVGKKLYLIAPEITKGNAIKRFMRDRQQDAVIVAGDGMLDVSMLNVADYAFPGPDIFDMIPKDIRCSVEEEILSDGICKNIKNMKKKGII